MKRKTRARVVLQKQISENIYDLRLSTDLAAEAHAGQFVGIYTGDRSKLLPRPISICEIDENRLRLVYRVTGTNTGTEIISHLTPGDEVDILGILGNGYDVDMIADTYRHPVLMGGGIGIPPMLELAKELDRAYTVRTLNATTGHMPESKGTECGSFETPMVSAILGYRDSDLFLSDEFRDVSNLYIATEDGSEGTRGNVLDVMSGQNIAGCDVILACGPMPMLRAIASYAKENGIKAYVSLEERMACGVGACLGCITTTKRTDAHSHVNNARICTDGPVFDTEDLII